MNLISRTRRVVLATAGILSTLAIAVPVDAADDPTPIVFVGDSITELCNSNFESFRGDALLALSAEDYLVDAVGSRNTEDCYPTDNEHEGRAGDTTADVLLRLPGGLASIAEVPEVAFVLLGTNDVQDDVPVATSIANLEAIMVELRAVNPTIHIVVAQIPPYPGKAAQTDQLNAEIALLATDGTSPISIADFHTGIDASHLFSDLIHLNSTGAALLGERAKDAIVATGRVSQPEPDAPTSVQGTVGIYSVSVTWEPPVDDGGTAVLDYLVEISSDGSTPLTSLIVPATSSRTALFTDLEVVAHTVTVRARTAYGYGPATSVDELTPVRAWGPFDSEQDFIIQQYEDFLGRPADGGGLAYWESLTNDDQSNVPETIEAFMRSAEFAPRRSVARLYLAFFERAPDLGGFDYWTQEISAGSANLDNVSQSFVGSPEFVATYGSLTDAEFVDLVYRNVLDRSPDQAGYDFWLGQMAGGMSRGQVMTRFSESSEYVDQTAADVDVIVTYRGMLDRQPDQAGYDFWVDRIGSDPNSLSTLIDNFYRSDEYADRVAPA